MMVLNQDFPWYILDLQVHAYVTKLLLAPFANGHKEIFGFAAEWEKWSLSKDFCEIFQRFIFN